MASSTASCVGERTDNHLLCGTAEDTVDEILILLKAGVFYNIYKSLLSWWTRATCRPILPNAAQQKGEVQM